MNTVKPNQSKITQNLTTAIATLEGLAKYRNATSEKKTHMLAGIIAVSLAYRHAPIPSDTDIVIGPYFVSNIEPDWNQALSELNEERVFDFTTVATLAKRVYMSRYDQAHGRKTLKAIINGITDNAYLSNADRTTLECLEDAYD